MAARARRAARRGRSTTIRGSHQAELQCDAARPQIAYNVEVAVSLRQQKHLQGSCENGGRNPRRNSAILKKILVATGYLDEAVHEHAFWCSIVLTRRATKEGRRQRAGHWQSASARKEGGGEGWSGCRWAFRATCWNIPMPLVGVQATSGSNDALNFCQTTAGITGLTPQSSISISIKNFIQHQH